MRDATELADQLVAGGMIVCVRMIACPDGSVNGGMCQCTHKHELVKLPSGLFYLGPQLRGLCPSLSTVVFGGPDEPMRFKCGVVVPRG